VVPLTSGSPSGQGVIELFRDAGKQGVFEFDPADPTGSLDQPFFSFGQKLQALVRVR
jgi:hypothetical protein